jgi:hypothetical protein
MKKWEYQIQSVPVLGNVAGVLNRLGEEGWELVAVVGPNYFLKRERR